jgi:hypothetical protein
MGYFDFAHVAQEAEIPEARLRDLCEIMRRDFPADDMLYELHMLRACMAIRDGLISLDDAFQPETRAQPA